MRILHTADWHLGDRLGRIDRTDDLRKAVERIADYCRSERADVLLVTGDLFSELARPDGLRDAIRHLQETFAAFLQDGGTVLALTGNHDNENFVQTLRHAMDLAAPVPEQSGEIAQTGRFHLAAGPTLLRLPDTAHDRIVQFLLMPYPTPNRYLTDKLSQRYASLAEKNQHLLAAFTAEMNRLLAHERFDPRLPVVLGAHVSVQGATLGSLFRMSEEEDVVLADDGRLEQFAYVALGHIHKPQAVGGRDHIRYSGSIERMDLGESADLKGTVLIDIDTAGRSSQTSILPLPATPIYEVSVVDPPTDIPRLRAEFPDAANDLVSLHVRYTAGRDVLEQVLADLEAIFPRWYRRDWSESNAQGPALTVGEAGSGSRGFEETVRDYLTAELVNEADEDRDAILALAEELMEQLKGDGP